MSWPEISVAFNSEIVIIRTGNYASGEKHLPLFSEYVLKMQPAAQGPSAPSEIRALLSPFDITEVTTQLQDATVLWNGSGPVEVELRGPSENVILYISPITYGGTCSLLVQARLAADRSIALSLEKINLYAVLISDADQEAIIARTEAHALSLWGIIPGLSYLLQIGNPPTVARGSCGASPADGVIDSSDILEGAGLFPPRERRNRRETLMSV